MDEEAVRPWKGDATNALNPEPARRVRPASMTTPLRARSDLANARRSDAGTTGVPICRQRLLSCRRRSITTTARTGGTRVMTSQLGRTLLASSSLSADEQRSSPDDDGTYDELTEIIDRAVLLSSEQSKDRPA